MNYILATLSGLFLVLSQPKFSLYPLVFGAFGPLLLALYRDKSQGFVLGLWTGFVYFYGLLYWLIGVMTHFGGLPWLAAAGVLALLALFLGAFWGLGVYLGLRYVGLSPGVLAALGWAGIFTLLDYARAYLLGGFPWGFPGQALAPWKGFIQVADLGGVYLVNFLVYLFNYALWAGLVFRRAAAATLGLAFLICALVLAYGHFRLTQTWPSQEIKVGLIQGNVPQDLKWSPEFQQETLARYERLSTKARLSGAQLVVWPETAVPFYFFPNRGLGQAFLSWTKNLGVPLLFGAPRVAWAHGRPRIHNSLFLVSQGRVLGVYDKQHLVPFGEYVPLEHVFPFLRTFAVASGDYSAGPYGRPLRLAQGEVFGPLICFESVFPRLARQRVRQGATMLVVVTNDAWFGRSAGPYQHFEAAIFRAIETRRYVVRAANTGISGVISPTGEVLYATKLETIAAPCVQAGFLAYLSPYTRYGAYLPVVYLLLALPAVLKSRFRRR